MCSSFSMDLPLYFLFGEHDSIDAIETRVIGCHDALSGCEPTENFELFHRASAHFDLTALRGVAVLGDDEDPVAAGAFQKGAGGKYERGCVPAELQSTLRGFAGDQVGWA